MILAIDVGNTETVLGLFEGTGPVHCWRIGTHRDRTGDERALKLRALLESDPWERAERVERALLASVVPSVDRSWVEAFRHLGIPLERVDWRTPLPIRMDVDEPASVGADRIVNTLGIACLVRRNTVIVDLGTATTFDCITADGAFLGGVISPGPRAGIDRLAQIASQLPNVEIRRPERVIGRRTVACLESGVFWAIVDAIDGTVRRILAEWAPEDPLVVATGGHATVVAPHCETVDRIDPFLTLRGLACADRYLRTGRCDTETEEASGDPRIESDGEGEAA